MCETRNWRPRPPSWPTHCAAKYNRSAMENARQLQCKALRRREKSRRRRNNGEQWKKQRAGQWKQSEIRARADASPGHIDTPQKQSPAAERRRAHTSKTRISAIAHPSAERTLKSAPVIPAGLSKKPATLAHTRWPCPEGGLTRGWAPVRR